MLKKYLDKKGLEQWHSLVDNAKNVIVMGHSGPDGDAMGSALALADWLRSGGRKVTVVMPNLYPDFLKWMPGVRDIILADRRHAATREAFEHCDLVVCVDFNGLGRLEEMQKLMDRSSAGRIMIDHHLDPEPFVDLTVSDSTACSTCEILFCLLDQLGAYGEISHDCAECIYCGMMTDTGSFTYNSTRPEIYNIVSRLLEKDIDKDRIYRNVYHNFSENRMRLVGYMLNEKMEYHSDLHASLLTLTKEEMRRYSFIKGDAEGIVNMPLEIRDTKLSISLREDTEKPVIRVSLRSVDDFPCNRMAEEFFNGGGHRNASGGTLKMTMEAAKARVNEALEAYRHLLAGEEAAKDANVKR